MLRNNAGNERLKRSYFTYLREARGLGDASIDAVAKALSRFEDFIGRQNFKGFQVEQAVAFKRQLLTEVNARTGAVLSRATVNATLAALRKFFIWLADKPGFRRKLSYSDADFFNLSEKDLRIAKAKREKPAPTIEQVHHVLATMPTTTDIELRNRALVASTLLTGARDGALASLKLKHLDVAGRRLDQDAREVNTKFSKTFSTWFFPVGGDALEIVTDWVAHLRGALLWGNDDPLFPASLMGHARGGGFVVAGLDRKHWSTASPIRRIFAQAFEAAGLPYFNPHSFRDTLTSLGERLCQGPEEFKAWSQNFGHEKVLTTFTSYGVVSSRRQAEIIASIGKPRVADSMAAMEERLSRLERVRE